MSEPRPDPAEVDHLEDQIGLLLAGQGPVLQGAVLACLLAAWLAGHQPSLRERLLQVHIRAVRELIRVYEAKMGRPWDTSH